MMLDNENTKEKTNSRHAWYLRARKKASYSIFNVCESQLYSHTYMEVYMPKHMQFLNKTNEIIIDRSICKNTRAQAHAHTRMRTPARTHMYAHMHVCTQTPKLVPELTKKVIKYTILTIRFQ